MRHLRTRQARAKLEERDSPYWEVIARSISLGYRRSSSQWLVRLYRNKRYSIQTLGPADDTPERGMSYAEALKASLKAEFRENKAPTVGEAFATYLDFLIHNRKSSHSINLKYKRHIAPTFEHTPIDQLTTAQIERWFYGLVRGSNDEDTRASRCTANRILNVFKAILNRAFRHGAPVNPAVWQRVSKFKGVDSARLRVLTEDEIPQLIEASEPNFARLLLGAILSGARYGELVQFRVRHFNGETLLVEQSKSSKSRHIPLTKQGAEFFSAQCRHKLPDAWMFVKHDGTQWKTSNAQLPMRNAYKAAGLEPVTFHACRHTYATRLLNNGAHLSVIAYALGHASTAMIEKHYGHLLAGTITREIRARTPDIQVNAQTQGYF